MAEDDLCLCVILGRSPLPIRTGNHMMLALAKDIRRNPNNLIQSSLPTHDIGILTPAEYSKKREKEKNK